MIKRAVAILLTASQVLLGIPIDVEALPASTPVVVVNKTVPRVDPVPLVPQFSNPPTEEEIFRARVFSEPVVAVGAQPAEAENQALAGALLRFHQGSGAARFNALESFVKAHPESPYRASILLNVGTAYRRDGFFTRALASLEQAWEQSKADTSAKGRAVADAALSELLDLNQHFGRQEAMEALLAEVKTRPVMGPAVEAIDAATHSVDTLKNHHEEAIPSGPNALWRIQTLEKGEHQPHEALKRFHATPSGASLEQIEKLSRTIGLKLKAAYREGDAPVPIPSLAHLKVGHFTAIVGETATHYKLDDIAFDGEVWITKEALADDGSGYFLISGDLAPGWRTATAEELRGARGKCVSWDWLWNPWPKPCDTCAGGGFGGGGGRTGGGGASGGGGAGGGWGLAAYDMEKATVGLLMSDIPVGYSPPRGASVNFQLSYYQRERMQPTTFSYSNLGPKWTFDWLSYIEDTPSNPNAAIKAYMRGGALENYSGYDGVSTFKPERQTQALLVRTSSSPIRYERRLPDGSVEVYAQSNGATSPRKVFLTQSIDPQGQSVSYTYDSSLRLVAVTDVIGQVTTLTYGLIEDPFKITKVTDPFGRSATLDYDASGRLVKITDVIGMASQFEYGSPTDFIRALTTPYGTTTFVGGASPVTRWLEARDPLGGVQRLEFRMASESIPDSAAAVPVGFGQDAQLQYRNSFYWDKRATALFPGDITRAEITQWAWFNHAINAAGTLSNYATSVKKPLEGRVWYAYEGGLGHDQLGPIAKASKMGRVLDDGTSQIYRYEYNNRGHITRFTDAVGRESVYTYAANEIDLLNVKQKNGGNYDLLQSFTYNSQHEPLTSTDAAGQVTTYTYNANGTVATIVTPPRGGLSAADRTTTFSYFADNASSGPARQQTIAAPLGASTSFTYDSYGRLQTTTAPDGYALAYDYDLLDRRTRIAYPDATYEETVYSKLDEEKHRDRLGRWTHTFHDALRRPASSRDATGDTTTQTWCACGSLDKVTDGKQGAITWERDVQGRITREVRSDGSDWLYIYENTTSRLKQLTDRKGQVRTYEYFADDNLKKITYPNPMPAVSFTYDAAYNRRITMTDATGLTAYSYGAIGTPPSLGASLLSSIDGPLSNDTITFGYDELGRANTRSVNGSPLSQTYDALGRVTAETNALGTFGYGYAGATGRITSISYPNGQTATYTYLGNTGDRRLQEIRNEASGSVLVSRFTYTYDVNGAIRTWAQQAGAGLVKTYAFRHDVDGQLADATLTDSTPALLKRYAYAYDGAGNRVAEQIDDSVSGATYNSLNELTSQQPGGALMFAGTVSEAASVTVQAKPAVVAADNKFAGSATVGSGTSTVAVTATDPAGNSRVNTYQVSQSGTSRTLSYDLNGNLTGDGSRTFEWDAADRLTAVNQGPLRSEFTYDGVGRRVRIIEKDNGVSTSDRRYLWSDDDLCEERDGTGTSTLKRFFQQGEQEGSTAYFYALDHLGSVREMTDGTAAVRARYEYDPFGRRTKVSGDKDAAFGFTRHFVHTPSALSFALFRAYDPSLGRWLSEDPIGLDGGPNLYAYVEGGPTEFRDPLGLVVAETGAAAGAAATGVAPWLVPGAGAGAAGTGAAGAAGAATGGGVASGTAAGVAGVTAGTVLIVAGIVILVIVVGVVVYKKYCGSVQTNYVLDKAKIQCPAGDWVCICNLLELWLDQVKQGQTPAGFEGKALNKLREDIEQAEKFARCRNIRKRGNR